MVRNSPISTGTMHYAVIDDQGVLYMAGNNKYGKLGDGTQNDSETPIVVKSFTEKVISVSCGDFFTIAITEDGKTYGWGRNTFNKSEKKRFLRPTLIDDLKEHRAIKVSCGGGEGWAVILDDGSVYYSILNHEDYVDVPLSGIISLEDRVIDISADTFRVAMVTGSGKLYFFGENFQGGIFGIFEPPEGTLVRPIHISFPSDFHISGKTIETVKIKQVSLSSHHIMALTVNGDIFTWGKNITGQLGIGTKGEKKSLETMKTVQEPQKLTGLPKISYINANLSSSSAITEDGRLYVWGANKIIQRLVRRLSKSRKEALKVGIIYRWRRGESSYVTFPVEIDIEEEYQPIGKRLRINYVSLSYYFSIISSEDGVVNYIGSRSLFS